MTPRIAIIGAGPGGCMLARLLSRHHISSIIFEAEESINYRSQGGTLDIRTSTGLLAIKEAGLLEEFKTCARYEDECLLVCDKKGTTWLKNSKPERKKGGKEGKEGEERKMEAPEIDRAVLRRLLMESLPEGTVKWGFRLLRIVFSSTSDLELHFANGQIERGFHLIVGADGAWSKVRNFLSEEKPFYSGVGGYSMSIPDAERRSPQAYKFVNRGNVFSYSDGKSVTGQQLGDGSIHVSFNSRTEEDYIKTCGFDPNDLKKVKEKVLEGVQDWTPELRNLVQSAEEESLVWRSYYMLPVGYTWEHRKGVTLLGDAAHLMTPFAGIGVNTAFYDAIMLTHAIVKAIDPESKDVDVNLDSEIVRYEKKMWAFAQKGQERTEGCMKDMFFTLGAPRTSIESWLLRHVKAETPKWQHPIAVAVVYTVYFFYKLLFV